MPPKEKNKKWFNITNKAKETADIYIFDEIGGWGIWAIEFINEFKTITADKINLYIDSPGGSIHHGMTIFNTIRQSGKDITTYVQGIAASIASVIALAGNTVVVPDNAMLMIHEPLVLMTGNSEELRKEALLLDKLRDQIAVIYANKTGIDIEEIKTMMADETWFTGEEALEKGFCDKCTESLKEVAFYNVEKYNYKKGEKYSNVFKKLNTNKPKNKENSKMNLEELKAKYPDLYNQIVKEAKEAALEEAKEANEQAISAAVEAETKRIASIDELADGTNSEIINAAKNDNKQTASTVAVAILKKQREDRSNAQENNNSDGQDLLNQAGGIDNSGADNSGSGGENLDQSEIAAAKAAAESVNKRK